MSVICPYCNSEARFVKGDVIYPHRPDLHSLKFYVCTPCDAYVGVHRRNPKAGFNGDEPKGRLANKELRVVKMKSHAVFDPLWLTRSMSRTQAYQWLADKMNISIEQCHIGMFDVEQCQQVIAICSTRESWSPPAMTDEEKIAHDKYVEEHSLPF